MAAEISLPVSLDDVAEAMSMTMRDTIEWYLDTQTGEVLMISSDMTEDDEMREAIEENADERFQRIPEMEPHESYEIMEDFVATVEDGGLRLRLSDAIAGKGAFRRFKNVLLDVPTERERWFAFEADRQRQGAIDWLCSIHIISTWKPTSPA